MQKPPLDVCRSFVHRIGVNIPVEVARAQGHHGIKGAVHGSRGASHGVKGGRPRLVLTDDERSARRALQLRESRERAKERAAPPPRPADFIETQDERIKRIVREANVRSREHARAYALEYAAKVRMGRVGQNDPCPCGSGRKFKKCCRG